MSNIKKNVKLLEEAAYSGVKGSIEYIDGRIDGVYDRLGEFQYLKSDPDVPLYSVQKYNFNEDPNIYTDIQTVLTRLTNKTQNKWVIVLYEGEYNIDETLKVNKNSTNHHIKFKGNGNVVINVTPDSLIEYNGIIEFENVTIQPTDETKLVKIKANKIKLKDVAFKNPNLDLFFTATNPAINGVYIEGCTFNISIISEFQTDFYLWSTNKSKDSYIRNSVFDFKSAGKKISLDIMGVHDFSSNTITTSGNNLATISEAKDLIFDIENSNISNCNFELYNLTFNLKSSQSKFINNRVKYITNDYFNNYNPDDENDDITLHPLFSKITLTDSNVDNNVFNHSSGTNFPHRFELTVKNASSFNFNTIIIDKLTGLSNFYSDINSQCIYSFLEGDISDNSRGKGILKTIK